MTSARWVTGKAYLFMNVSSARFFSVRLCSYIQRSIIRCNNQSENGDNCAALVPASQIAWFTCVRWSNSDATQRRTSLNGPLRQLDDYEAKRTVRTRENHGVAL